MSRENQGKLNITKQPQGAEGALHLHLGDISKSSPMDSIFICTSADSSENKDQCLSVGHTIPQMLHYKKTKAAMQSLKIYSLCSLNLTSLCVFRLCKCICYVTQHSILCYTK